MTTTASSARPTDADREAATRARIDRLETLVAVLTQRADERTTDTTSPDEAQPPLYDNVEDWVREYLLVNFSRPFGAVGLQRWYWCEQWWRHNEAVTTLTALWYAWEHARLQPTGMIGWLHELHYMLGIMCSADGPFRTCAPTDGDRHAKHQPDHFAEITPAPTNWWDWWSES